MSKASILIVEDENLVAMALEEFFRELDYRVVGCVTTGEQAIELAAKDRPDLAVMDVQLGGELDGVETAERLRELYGVRSIFLTAYADPTTLKRIKETEPFGYVVKPFVGKLLEVTLEVALYRKRAEAERAEIERQLRSSEARYRGLARWSPVGIFEADAEGMCRYVNERWEEIAGLTRDEAEGDGWLRAVAPADRERVERIWRRSVADGMPATWECALGHADGTFRNVYAQTGPELAGGNFRGFVGAMTDVTELRDAQDRLQLSEQTLEVVTSHLPLLLAELDTDLTFLFAHGDFHTWFGTEAASIVGRRARDVLGAELDAAVRQLDDKARDRRVDFDIEIRSSDGPCWLRITLVEQLDARGELDGYSLLGLDVTTLKRHESVRRKAEARYAAILDNSPDAIVSVGDDGRMTVFSRGAERMFGYTSQEVLGKPLDVIIPDDRRDEHRDLLRAFVNEGVGWKTMGERPEVQGLRKDGSTFPAEAVIGAVNDAGERLYTAIVRDVSERKELEDQYFQAQKMEALGRLAGGVAHDFNNVLSSIVGQVELMKLDALGDERVKAGLDEVLKDCERAASLTRQMLLFSRQRMPAPRVIDVGEVLSNMKNMLKRVIDERVELRLRVDPSALRVRMDPNQLEQVVVNLAVNARDAMPSGGVLSIAVSSEELAEGDARARRGIAPGPYVELEVRDTGQGMNREVMSRMFEPFFSTKPATKGTGLGLATVFGITSRAQGRVTAKSLPGRGTTVTVLLPRVLDEMSPGEAAAPAVSRTGEETILVVEDNEGVRRTTGEILERLGYRVLLAANGADAVKLVENRSAEIDLLLSDMVMPHMSGRELAGRLKRIRPTMKMVFMTGYSEDEPSADESGAPHTLQKPFSANELSTRIREVLDTTFDVPVASGQPVGE